MNKFIIYSCIIVILLIIIFKKKSEKFMDIKLKDKILEGIRLNYPEIENIDDLEIKEIPDSDKILIKDMIKLYPIKSLFFSHNLDLENYSSVLNQQMVNFSPDTLQLKYNSGISESVHNLKTSFSIGENLITQSDNTSYGVQFKYFPEKYSANNRATLSLEFNSFMDLHLTKIQKMNQVLAMEEPEKKRMPVEVISKNTQKHDFFPYFKSDEVKALVLFKDAKNLEFINSLNGFFNILDIKGNRILTKCKLDNPYCITHLPQKGKIYGRDQYIVGRFNPFLGKLQVLEKDKSIENFVASFQDDSIDDEIKEPINKVDDSNYLKYITKKYCLLEKDKNKARIEKQQYSENPNLDEITDIKNLKPFQKLAGTKCIKHSKETRDDFFYGGLDKDNNSFCYGVDDECFMFKNETECQQMGLDELLSLPLPNQIKGIDYDLEERPMYDAETIKTLQTSLGATLEEDGNDFILKCPDGQYLEGTYNPEDKSAIYGGIYRDCSDPTHPENESCAPGSSNHLSELITNKGNKVYDSTDSNFGDLKGKCINMNIPEGEMMECDAEDSHQPCYVGDRSTGVPSESNISNADHYNKFLGFNCQTRILNTNTCKHNNNGVLSDVISFRDPVEENYLDILDKQKLLELSGDYEVSMATDEEKYLTENLHVLIEKYDEQFENKNPNIYFDKLRYTLKIVEHYDMLNKEEKNKLVVYYKNKEEATLTTNDGGIYFIQPNELIEIILKKDGLVLFRIIDSVSKIVKSSYTSTNILEGEFGSAMNFYVAQNNNTFIRNIKYKERVPKTVLPYNPFIDVKQI